jgi:hypothetical protein
LRIVKQSAERGREFLVAVALSVPGALVEVALVVPVWVLRLVLW